MMFLSTTRVDLATLSLLVCCYGPPGPTALPFLRNCKFPGIISFACSPSKTMSKSRGSAYGSSNGCTAHSIGSFCIFGYNRAQLALSSAFLCAQHTRAMFVDISFVPPSGTVSVPMPFHVTPKPFVLTTMLQLNTFSSSSVVVDNSGKPPVRSIRSLRSLSSRFRFSSGDGSGANSFKNAPPFFAAVVILIDGVLFVLVLVGRDDDDGPKARRPRPRWWCWWKDDVNDDDISFVVAVVVVCVVIIFIYSIYRLSLSTQGGSSSTVYRYCALMAPPPPLPSPLERRRRRDDGGGSVVVLAVVLALFDDASRNTTRRRRTEEELKKRKT